MEEDPWFGLIKQGTMVNGNITMLAVKASFITLMAMYTTALGLTTKQMGMESTRMSRVLGMRVIGKRISSTGMELRHGQKVLNMMETTR